MGILHVQHMLCSLSCSLVAAWFESNTHTNMVPWMSREGKRFTCTGSGPVSVEAMRTRRSKVFKSTSHSGVATLDGSSRADQLPVTTHVLVDD
jgi:hypothetical protein